MICASPSGPASNWSEEEECIEQKNSLQPICRECDCPICIGFVRRLARAREAATEYHLDAAICMQCGHLGLRGRLLGHLYRECSGTTKSHSIDWNIGDGDTGGQWPTEWRNKPIRDGRISRSLWRRAHIYRVGEVHVRDLLMDSAVRLERLHGAVEW